MLRLRRFVAAKLVQNALSLYGVQIVGSITSLVTVPYLARVLGPGNLGVLAMTQALGGYLALTIEYGFALSATREVSRWRDDRGRLSQLVAGVVGAQCLLAIILLPVPVIVSAWVPALKNYPALVWVAYAWAVLLAANLAWFFQGLERMRLVAALDVGARIVSTAGILLFVRTPDDLVTVLALYAATSAIVLTIGWIIVMREVSRVRLSLSESWATLRLGWSLFLVRSASSLYTVGSSFILGLFAPTNIVGYYSAADRISRTVLNLLGPFNQTLYPRLWYLARSAWQDAIRLARTSLRVMGAGGGVLGAVLYLTAPVLVRLLLGTSFLPTIPVVRVLALLPPLTAVSNVLGLQWMLPLGLDTAFKRIFLTAGLLNLTIAYLLTPSFGHLGMAWSVVLVEGFVTLTMYMYLQARGLNPMMHTVNQRLQA